MLINPGSRECYNSRAMKAASSTDERRPASQSSRRLDSTRLSQRERQLLAVYRVMLLSRKLDDKEIQLKHQSQIFFQISGAGHEAILVAAGLTLKAGYDWFFPYYRDRALCLQLGVTPLDMLLAGVGAKDDPARAAARCRRTGATPPATSSRGRAPTGTQVLQAVGAAEAGVIYSRVAADPGSRVALPGRRDRLRLARRRRDERGRVLGSAEHGLHSGACPCSSSSRTTATRSRCRSKCRRRAATSRASSDRFPACTSIRSTAPISSPAFAPCATATAYVRARKGPAFVHAHVIRPYSHSLSDDEKLYKTPAEREAEARRDPIAPVRRVPDARAASRPTRTSPAIAADDRPRGERGGRSRRCRRRSRRRTPPRSGSIRRTSIRRRRRSTRRRSPRASPTRWSARSTAR